MAIALLMSVGAKSQKLGDTYKNVFASVTTKKNANFQAHDFHRDSTDYRSIIDVTSARATHYNFHAYKRDDAPLVNILEFYKKTPEGEKELENRKKFIKSLTLHEDGESYIGKANGVACLIRIEKVVNNDPTYELFWLKECVVVNKF